MPSKKGSKKSSRASSSTGRSSARSSTAFTKTEIIINVYDLLPAGAVSTCLWPLGLSLLHTGIVLNDKEYAYGATDAQTPDGNQTGIFWTRPRMEPPGGTFRCSILQGITYLTPEGIEEILREASTKFPGTAYNLLTNNCNHFTSYMCRMLTHRDAPAWINRASRVGKLLPCLVPTEWLNPPDADTAAELTSDYDEDAQEDSSLLRPYRDEEEGPSQEPHDEEGRRLPASERAPSNRLI